MQGVYDCHLFSATVCGTSHYEVQPQHWGSATVWYKPLGNQKGPIRTFCVVIFIAIVQGLRFLITKHTLRIFRGFLLPDLGDRHALPDIG